ncbi:MAG TPA: PspC domain-containing protein, partial [Panacibacter sp.]|nr:PspC domain-containing protein [Panacibacter sp.]
VININFQGRVVPIEETAYDILKQYVESLRLYFDTEEGKEEIINDIEGRIAELFAETLKKGSTCITDDDVNAIIKSMGRPEEFEAEEASVKAQLSGESKQQQSYSSSSYTQSENTAGTRPSRLFRDENNKLLGGVCAGIANYFGIDKIIVRILFILGFGITFIPYLILWVAVPSSASTVIGSVRKRLYRDPENKLIAGVCGGLSSYFGINVWIPRVLFLIPFISFVTNWDHWGMFNLPNFVSLSFSPGSILIYIILWLVIPEAQSTSEKLEMKGEKVDMNSIKNTIQKDMEGFGERAKEFGKEVGEKAAELGTKIGERSKQVGAEAGSVARKTSTGLGDVIAMIFKIFAYFILAIVLFSLVVSLFGVGVVFTGLLPLKEYLISDGWQTLFVWGALVLFIWVPVIGIITWIIRRIAKVRTNSSFIRYTFIALWLIGLFCVLGLITSLSNDFQYHNSPVETPVRLSNPSVSKLELKDAPDTRYYVNNSWLHLEPFASIDQDTVRVKNIRLRIMKSATDSFQVSILKMASGASRQEAEERVSTMNYSINQRDSLLEFERGFAITPKEKFRNQIIYVTIQVPVGKRILVDRNTYWNDYVHIGMGWEMNEWDWRNEGNNGYDWDSDVEYIMTESGLKRVHPKLNDENDDNNFNEQQPAQPADPAPADSGRYHYQPSQKEDTTPAKNEQKASLLPAIEKHLFSIDIHDLASTFLGSATI